MAQELKPPSVSVQVTRSVEVKHASNAARDFAATIRFTPAECEEISLAATELASNLVKHAGGGVIKLSSIEAQGRTGIQIESEDTGPGIVHTEEALTDGYSTTGSLGTGLGAVNRLMDELEFHNRPDNGLHILCQRWRRAPVRSPSHRWLEFGAATRPRRLLPENGDAVVLRQWEGCALAGVIDGLGHGPLAQRASQTARQYVEHHFDQPLESLFRGVGRTCRATRGVVMALARFDMTRQKVALASVGNVEVCLIDGKVRSNIIVRRGILGLNAPNPVITEFPWNPTNILIIHSDGLSPRWQWDDFRESAHETSGIIARQMLRKLGRIEDDASVVVIKNVDS
jgi:anti-sigma regulatory factor (Ser/Thr protein kinase)